MHQIADNNRYTMAVRTMDCVELAVTNVLEESVA